jgi:hypothetical protein
MPAKKKAEPKKVPAKKKAAATKPAPPPTPFMFVRVDDDTERVLLDGQRIGAVTNNEGTWSYRLASRWNEPHGPFPTREEAAEALRAATA